MRARVIISMFLFMYAPMFAQDKETDPLNKPAIWEKLASSPTDSKLWASYLGKDLFDLSSDEVANLQKWRAHLINKNLSEEQKQQSLVNSRIIGSAKVLTEAQYQSLLSDVIGNFVIIEDYFAEKFKALGYTYKTYESVHPDKTYSKILWVVEQEDLLIELAKKASASR